MFYGFAIYFFVHFIFKSYQPWVPWDYTQKCTLFGPAVPREIWNTYTLTYILTCKQTRDRYIDILYYGCKLLFSLVLHICRIISIYFYS